MSDELLRERQGHIEILTINRPEARNAINLATATALSDALDEIEADDDVWVVCSRRRATRRSRPAWT